MKGAIADSTPLECRKAIESALGKLGIHRWTWKPAPKIGAVQMWSAFDLKTLNWLQIQATTNGSKLKSTRILHSNESAAGVIQVADQGKCDPQLNASLDSLFDILNNQPPVGNVNTLFYSYSAAMPLSIEGLSSILEIAEKKKFEIVFLADRNMPAEEQRKVQNEILRDHVDQVAKVPISWKTLEHPGYMYRGLDRQFPSILASIDGRLQSDAYAGHKPKEVWMKWLSASLSEAKGRK
jgi:hypothetical protein